MKKGVHISSEFSYILPPSHKCQKTSYKDLELLDGPFTLEWTLGGVGDLFDAIRCVWFAPRIRGHVQLRGHVHVRVVRVYDCRVVMTWLAIVTSLLKVEW